VSKVREASDVEFKVLELDLLTADRVGMCENTVLRMYDLDLAKNK
jgi:hypothetical protein